MELVAAPMRRRTPPELLGCAREAEGRPRLPGQSWRATVEDRPDGTPREATVKLCRVQRIVATLRATAWSTRWTALRVVPSGSHLQPAG